MENVLSSMGVANILASGGLKEILPLLVHQFPLATPRVSRPSREVVIRSTSPIPINIPSVSKEDKKKRKAIMTEPENHDKAKTLELMSDQLARELEAKFAQEDQAIREQVERDAKIARIQAKEDLKRMIDELDRSNEMINKHMAEYEEAKNDLSSEEKTELITKLIKYQKYLARIKKYQAQQQKLASKIERRKFYTSVLRSHVGWKSKDFKDFVPMDSKEESERLKRPGILLEKVKANRLKTGDGLAQEQLSEDVDIAPSVVKAPICDWKIFKDKLREEFEKDDMVTLWKLVKDRFEEELPKSDLEKCLFWPLKVIVHCLIMEGMIIYMLDDIKYPLQKFTLQKMLDHKCEVSEFNEDVIQMINLIRRQLKKE
ncbi:hypothetical protein Tco_0267169 [Tanacetum coccineum]